MASGIEGRGPVAGGRALGGDGLKEVAVAADGVDGARVPDVLDVVVPDHVGQECHMVLVRMTQDDVVDLAKVGRDRLQVG